MPQRSKLMLALIDPGVLLVRCGALPLAKAYFWAISPLVLWLHHRAEFKGYRGRRP